MLLKRKLKVKLSWLKLFIILTVKTPTDHNSPVHIVLLEKDGSVGYGYTF